MNPRNRDFWINVLDRSLHEKYECKRISSRIIYVINGEDEFARFMHFARQRGYHNDPFIIRDRVGTELSHIDINRPIYINAYSEKWKCFKNKQRCLDISNEWVQFPQYTHIPVSMIIDYKKEFRGHKLKNYGI